MTAPAATGGRGKAAVWIGLAVAALKRPVPGPA